MHITELAKNIMYEQTLKNLAPARWLTQIAVQKWKELSKLYDVDEDIVITSLYLAHTIFDTIRWWEIQKNHPQLSAEFAKPLLKKRNINPETQNIIINAIQAHHDHIPTHSLIAEIVKNAECYKFITLPWSLIFFHDLGTRQVWLSEAAEKVIKKMEQKQSLLTLESCIQETALTCKTIRQHFEPLIS